MVSIGWDSAYNGDEAVLLGGSGEAAITIEELAAWSGTIPHEVLTSINTRVPRVYKLGGGLRPPSDGRHAPGGAFLPASPQD